MMLPLFFILLFVLYTALIMYYWLAWKKVPQFSEAISSPQTKVSVIIAARNEEKNIATLLIALQQQTYPSSLTEIIVVDDHSEDTTAAIVQNFPFAKLISMKDDGINSFKKKAIDTGIRSSSGSLIITTDADCVPTKDWLQTIVSFYQYKQAIFIAAPVVITGNGSLLSFFQQLDFLVLQGITAAAVQAGSHSMSNGANMAYEKNAFVSVNGFAGIDQIASGDDMLLMHKINKQFPKRSFYLKAKEAIVSTAAEKTWKHFFNQRIRWASKAKYYDDKRIFFVLLLVWLFNFSFAAFFIAAFFNSVYWWWLICGLLAKTAIEFPFVNSVAYFFDKQKLMRWFLFFQPLHILYTIVAGLFGQFGKYQWKGRTVR